MKRKKQIIYFCLSFNSFQVFTLPNIVEMLLISNSPKPIIYLFDFIYVW